MRLRKPARGRRAGAMRQFPTAQINSTSTKYDTSTAVPLGIWILKIPKLTTAVCTHNCIDTKFSTHTPWCTLTKFSMFSTRVCAPAAHRRKVYRKINTI